MSDGPQGGGVAGDGDVGGAKGGGELGGGDGYGTPMQLSSSVLAVELKLVATGVMQPRTTGTHVSGAVASAS